MDYSKSGGRALLGATIRTGPLWKKLLRKWLGISTVKEKYFKTNVETKGKYLYYLNYR